MCAGTDAASEPNGIVRNCANQPLPGNDDKLSSITQSRVNQRGHFDLDLN